MLRLDQHGKEVSRMELKVGTLIPLSTDWWNQAFKQVPLKEWKKGDIAFLMAMGKPRHIKAVRPDWWVVTADGKIWCSTPNDIIWVLDLDVVNEYLQNQREQARI